MQHNKQTEDQHKKGEHNAHFETWKLIVKHMQSQNYIFNVVNFKLYVV